MPKQPPVESGQSLIELILAIALTSLFLGTFAVGTILIRESYARSDKSLEASLLLQKEIESLRSVKETNWSSFAPSGTYHTEPNGNGFKAISDTFNETVGGTIFTRGFTVSNVCRANVSASSALVDCSTPGAIIDPSTKKIVFSVTWSFLGNQSISTTQYFSRVFGNKVWRQTLAADFNSFGNVKTNTIVNNDSIELSTITAPNWKSPGSPVLRDFSGTNIDANDIFVLGNRAYVVTNNRPGSGATGYELLIYDITTPGNPSANPIGGADLGVNTNAYSVIVSGNYAYIATSNDARELAIVNLTSFITSGYNAPTGADGRGIALSGAIAYLTTDNNTTAPGAELYLVNVTNPAAPTLVSASSYHDLSAGARDIFVSGSYVYIASTHNSQELQIVNVTSPSSLPAPVTYDITSSSADALTVYVSGTTVYLGAGNNLYLLTFTPSPAGIALVSTYAASGTVNGVFVSGTLAFIGTANNTREFQIVNYCTPNTPVPQGFSNLGSSGGGDNINGVFVNGNYVFLATASNAGEFTIVQGGPAYQASGTFESSVLDGATNVGFNYLNWVMATPIPACVTTRLQISTTNTAIPWTALYAGPTGTGSFFTVPGAVSLDYIANRYAKYKITINADGNTTPSVQEVSLNYSP